MIAEKLQTARRIGDFTVENLGVDYPDYFPGYGLGPSSTYAHCCYGVGATVADALDDCLESAAQQGWDIDVETENRIIAELDGYDDSDTAAECIGVVDTEDFDGYFHVGLKWNSKAQERLARLRKIHGLEWLRYESYERIGRNDNDTFSGHWDYVRRADGDVSYGDLKEMDCPDDADKYLDALCVDSTEEGEVYFFVPYASGSDYSGSTVSKANYNCFIEEYGNNEFVFSAHGGFSTYAACIGLTGLLTCDDDVFDAVCETLEGLEDYPVIDEEALSQLETDTTDEEWDSWAKSDFIRALEKQFIGVDFLWPDDMREFFEDCRERANEYWEAEQSGCSMHVRIDNIVEKIGFDDVSHWAVCYELTYLDCGTEREDYFVEDEVIERIKQLENDGIPYAHYVEREPAATVRCVNCRKYTLADTPLCSHCGRHSATYTKGE